MRKYLQVALCAWLLLGTCFAEEGDARWNITAECQMVVLSQRLLLPLLSDLNDEKKIDATYTRIQELITKGDAQLSANIVAKARDSQTAFAESVEELRYPTEFDPPQVPPNAPENIEVLKAWPVIGITPTAFDSRKVGAMIELKATVRKDGNSIDIETTPQNVRFLRWTKTDAGTLADGKHIFVEQPVFHTCKSTVTTTVRNGQRILLGVHKLSEPKDTFELFLLKVTAAPAP